MNYASVCTYDPLIYCMVFCCFWTLYHLFLLLSHGFISPFHLHFLPCFCRLQNYDATCRLAQEIAENIHERNKQLRTGGNPAKVFTHEFRYCAHLSPNYNVDGMLPVCFRSTWHWEHHCRSWSRILASLKMDCCEHPHRGACILCLSFQLSNFMKFTWL